MRRTEDYRKNAEDCRELARKMPPAHRAQLLDMALQWDRLAEDREKALAEGRDPAP